MNLTKTMNRPARYIVVNPYENQPASYNFSLGTVANDQALHYAIQNASRFHGKIILETTDGAQFTHKSYERIEKSYKEQV